MKNIDQILPDLNKKVVYQHFQTKVHIDNHCTSIEALRLIKQGWAILRRNLRTQLGSNQLFYVRDGQVVIKKNPTIVSIDERSGIVEYAGVLHHEAVLNIFIYFKP